MMAMAEVERPHCDHLAVVWEVAIKEGIPRRFTPAVDILCRELNIEPPVSIRSFHEQGQRYRVYGFRRPEEVAAFLGRISRTSGDFDPRVVTPASVMLAWLSAAGPAS